MAAPLLALLAAAALALAPAGAQPSQHRQRPLLCHLGVAPLAPRGLVAVPRGDGALLSWVSPQNRPCDAAYLVTAAPTGAGASSAGAVTTLRVEGLYAELPGLLPGVEYALAVRAVGPAGEGPPATAAFARPASAAAGGGAKPAPAGARPWACQAVEGYAPCPAAAAGLCAPAPCVRLAAEGRCGAEALRGTDWAARRVVQRCAEACACAAAAAPALLESLLPPPDDWCCAFGAAEYFRGAGGAAVAALPA
jgi:hypothetical protein